MSFERKRKGIEDVVDEHATRRKFKTDAHSQLATKALTIVLQQWMIPKVDWSIEVINERIPSLKNEIKEDFKLEINDPTIPTEEMKLLREKDLEERLSMNGAVKSTFCVNEGARLIDHFDNFPRDELFPEASVQVSVQFSLSLSFFH